MTQFRHSCAVCGPQPHAHGPDFMGRGCFEDTCAGYWENEDWYEKRKRHGCLWDDGPVRRPLDSAPQGE